MGRTCVASAPGKLVLFGEYVVLEGAPALVMATPCRATATFVPNPDARPWWQLTAKNLGLTLTLALGPDGIMPKGPVPDGLRLAVALLDDVVQEAGNALPFGHLTLDTTAFYQGTTKLGLGSSAAVATAAWAALRHAGGLEKVTPVVAVSRLRKLHQMAQGGYGSGVDLAAAWHGGLVRYQLAAPAAQGAQQAAAMSITRAKALPGLHVLPVWTRTAASTGPYLVAFARLKLDQPALYWRLCEHMAVISRGACELWNMGELTPMLPLVTQAMVALDKLGDAMGMQMVTPAHAQAAALCQSVGAYYKTSGAGGGDFGLVMAASPRALRRASRALAQAGFVPMPQDQDDHGVTVRAVD